MEVLQSRLEETTSWRHEYEAKRRISTHSYDSSVQKLVADLHTLEDLGALVLNDYLGFVEEADRAAARPIKQQILEAKSADNFQMTAHKSVVIPAGGSLLTNIIGKQELASAMKLEENCTVVPGILVGADQCNNAPQQMQLKQLPVTHPSTLQAQGILNLPVVEVLPASPSRQDSGRPSSQSEGSPSTELQDSKDFGSNRKRLASFTEGPQGPTEKAKRHCEGEKRRVAQISATMEAIKTELQTNANAPAGLGRQEVLDEAFRRLIELRKHNAVLSQILAQGHVAGMNAVAMNQLQLGQLPAL